MVKPWHWSMCAWVCCSNIQITLLLIFRCQYSLYLSLSLSFNCEWLTNGQRVGEGWVNSVATVFAAAFVAEGTFSIQVHYQNMRAQTVCEQSHCIHMITVEHCNFDFILNRFRTVQSHVCEHWASKRKRFIESHVEKCQAQSYVYRARSCTRQTNPICATPASTVHWHTHDMFKIRTARITISNHTLFHMRTYTQTHSLAHTSFDIWIWHTHTHTHTRNLHGMVTQTECTTCYAKYQIYAVAVCGSPQN